MTLKKSTIAVTVVLILLMTVLAVMAENPAWKETLINGLKNEPAMIYCASGENPYKIACIDGTTHKVIHEWPMDSPVINLALRPDGKEIWCISAELPNFGSIDYPITIADSKNGQILASINCPSGGSLGFTPDGTKAYVTLNKGNEIAVFDVINRKELKRITVGNHPCNISISFDGKKAYVGHGPMITGEMPAFDMSQFENIDWEAENMDPAILEFLENPVMMGMEPGSEFISVIDIKTDTVIENIELNGWSPVNAVSPDGKFLYANVNSMDFANMENENYTPDPNRWDGIAVIDTDTLQIIKKITFPDLNGSPSVIAFTPDGKKAYTICSTDDLIVPITVSNHQRGESFALNLGG